MKEAKRKENKKKTVIVTEEEEVTKLPKETIEALVTEALQLDPLLDDVEEEEEALVTRRRRGKMILTDSESTKTEGYAKTTLDTQENIPLISMLEKK